MKNNSAGLLLKNQRTRTGLSVEEVSRKTYIRKTYIEAIEEGAYDRIADPVYTRGFIRNYAQLVGLDSEEMIRIFDEEIGAGTPVHLPDMTRKHIRHVGNGMGRNIQVLNSNSAMIREKRSFGKVEWFIILLLVFSVALFWVWLFWL